MAPIHMTELVDAPMPTAKMEVLMAYVAAGLLLLLAPPATRHPPRQAGAALHSKCRGKTTPIWHQLARACDSGFAVLVEVVLTAIRTHLPPPLLVFRPHRFAVLPLLPLCITRFPRPLLAGSHLPTQASLANVLVGWTERELGSWMRGAQTLHCTIASESCPLAIVKNLRF
jgi:hypothetical protein